MDVQYFKDTFHLALNSSKPLYQQLYDYFKRQIIAGILKEGDQMLPETLICDELNISRSTVRKTMDMLIEDGLLVRHRGKGSFVTNQKLRRQINYLYNFTENMDSIGAVPSSIILEAKVTDDLSEDIAEKLNLPSGNHKVFYLKRIRCANGKPVLRELTYIPYHLCPGIENNDFSKVSLYETLETQYLLTPYHAQESIEAVFLSKENKKILECEQDVPGIKISRLSKLESGEVIEYTTSITRADKCVFVMDLYRGGSSNSSPVQVERSLSL